MDFCPVPFLEVLPEHRVLDISGAWCKELAEALHWKRPGEIYPISQPLPTGLLVCNAAKHDDLEQLVAKVPEHLRSPVVFTSCLPHRFPRLYSATPKADGPIVMGFDRVLCSVTSSYEKFQAWHMHPLQLRTLQRTLRSLAPGGRLLYVTRSQLAIENEAVVAAALASERQVTLREMNFSRHETWCAECGSGAWQVPDPSKAGDGFVSWEEVPKRLRGGKILESMFPPQQKERSLQLSRCLHAKKTDDSASFFIALFQKESCMDVSDSDCDENPESLSLPPGLSVIVKATGAPATVVGPGQKTFKGLIKIRYPDRSTYHVELSDLHDADDRNRKLFHLQLVVAGLFSLGFRRWLSRVVKYPKCILFGLLLSLLGWRLRERRNGKIENRKVARSKAPAPSRLLKQCAKIPDPVLSFCEFYGLEGVDVQRPGQTQFPYHNVGYRTTDKQNLYLASASVFDLRVPEQLRHSMCGAPFLQRPEERQRWGCPLRPSSTAAWVLCGCTMGRKVVIDSEAYGRLVRDGYIKLSSAQRELSDGGIILVQEAEGRVGKCMPAVLRSEIIYLT